MDARVLLAAVERALPRGLLSIDVDATFVDAAHACPRRASLVVHLDRLLPDAPSRLEDAAVRRVLAAVGQLCELAERHRAWLNQGRVFWFSVLGSEMMQCAWDTRKDRRLVERLARCVKHLGFDVVLSWDARALDAAIVEPMREFLATPRAVFDQRTKIFTKRLPSVGIRWSKCGLSSVHIELLARLLETVGDDAGGELACLDLSGNVLREPELDALSDLLERESTWRIEELRLDGALPPTGPYTIKYAAAFKRLIRLATRARAPEDETIPVALSLASNKGFVKGHAEAIVAAVTSPESRPLRSLSLAWSQVSPEAWAVLTPLWIATHNDKTLAARQDATDLELNLTGTSIFAARRACQERITRAVAAALPDVVAAIESGVPVTCLPTRQVAYRAQSAMPDSELALPSGVFLRVVHVHADGWLMIRFRDQVADILQRTTGYLQTSGISCLKIGDRDIVGPRLAGLILDGMAGPEGSFTPIAAVPGFLQVFRNSLRRLAVRGYADASLLKKTLHESCPLLEDLNLERSCVRVPIHAVFLSEAFPPGRFARLRALNAENIVGVNSHTGHGDAHDQLAHLPLRVLYFHGNRPTHERFDWLRSVRTLLRNCPTLEYIELDSREDDNVWGDAGPLRVTVDRDVAAADVLTEATKLAFLSVAAHVQRRRCSVDVFTLSNILSFVGKKQTRQIVWCDPVDASSQ